MGFVAYWVYPLESIIFLTQNNLYMSEITNTADSPHPKRRDFIKKTALTAMALPFFETMPVAAFDLNKHINELPIHLFSKHLQFLDYKAAGEKAAEMGFAGLDLTVRPDGHVLPENVATSLPRALEEIQKGGSKCHLMTTAVESTANPIDVHLLRTAATNGIQFYRCNWYTYPEKGSLVEALDGFGKKLKGLSLLNKKLGMIGCYQNHAGTRVGASIWEIKKMLSQVDQIYFGAQFDIRHATVEGGLSWENSVRLIHPNIKTIVLKDFEWKKKNGQWKVVNVPIGEGMVDFKTYFGLLKKYGIQVPAILHVEYDLGGAEHGNRKIKISPETVYKAMKSDLTKLQRLWAEA